MGCVVSKIYECRSFTTKKKKQQQNNLVYLSYSFQLWSFTTNFSKALKQYVHFKCAVKLLIYYEIMLKSLQRVITVVHMAVGIPLMGVEITRGSSDRVLCTDKTLVWV